MDKWLAFYRPYFTSEYEVQRFVKSCEAHPNFLSLDETKNFLEACKTHEPTQEEWEKFRKSWKNHPKNVPIIMMHQVQRLISLSDDIQKIRPNDEPLQLLFLIMCVENITKLHDDYGGQANSKFYVKKFFDDFLTDDDKDLLRNGFIDNNDKNLSTLSLEDVIEMFYKIRCDVVHEGNYLNFSFYNGEFEVLNFGPFIKRTKDNQDIKKPKIIQCIVVPTITLKEVRDIIIHGCIRAIQDKLQT